MIPRDSREQRGEQATIKRLRPTILTRPCPHYALPICHTRHRGDPCFRSLSGHAGYIYILLHVSRRSSARYTPWILVDLLRDDDNGGRMCILEKQRETGHNPRLGVIIDP